MVSFDSDNSRVDKVEVTIVLQMVEIMVPLEREWRI